ncbi:MAG: hypothetical protein Q9187_007275, partial [Circinaria calcarea]
METELRIAEVPTNCILYLKKPDEVSPLQLTAAQMDKGALDHPVLVVETFASEREVEVCLLTTFKGRTINQRFPNASAEFLLQYVAIFPQKPVEDGGHQLEITGQYNVKGGYLDITRSFRVSIDMLRYYSGPPAERVKLTPRSFSVVLTHTRGPRRCVFWDRNGLRSHPKHARSSLAAVKLPLSRSRIDPSISQIPLLATKEMLSSEMGSSIAKPMLAKDDKINDAPITPASTTPASTTPASTTSASTTSASTTPASTTLPSVPVDFQSMEGIHFGTNEDPSNKIIYGVLKSTALELRRHILKLLPGGSHPVSQAANHFL